MVAEAPHELEVLGSIVLLEVMESEQTVSTFLSLSLTTCSVRSLDVGN